MIFYLVTKNGTQAIERFCQQWAKSLASSIKILPYEDFTEEQALQPGTYIFAELPSLLPEGAEFLANVWETMVKSWKNVRLLNHPTRSMRRYELLRTLYERDLNGFNVYRVTEVRRPERFPVFLRGEAQNPLTPLLHTQEELDAAIVEMDRQGLSRENKLIVEFCDTSDKKGIFRKYSAFRIGNRVIASHMNFSRNWLIKPGRPSPENMTPKENMAAELIEEWQFVKNNPHEAEIREVFELARIDYGRMDYALLDGAPQVWEINTNPTIVGRSRARTGHQPLTQHVVEQLLSAFREIDASPQEFSQVRAEGA